MAMAAAAPATAIPAIAPVLSGALCTRGAAGVVLEVSGFARIVLETADGVGVRSVEVLRVVKAVTIEGDPVAVTNVDSAGVVEGSAIDGGEMVEEAAEGVKVDLELEVGPTVAVTVASVSGTEFMIPAQML